MAAASKGKNGGGKLARSETVTVRLTPKMRYVAELAARKHHRTLSSFIEWAVDEALHSVLLFEGIEDGKRTGDSFAAVGNTLWHPKESVRFLNLGFIYPDLLSYSDQLIWQVIHEYELIRTVRGKNVGILRFFDDGMVNSDAVYSCWQEIKNYSIDENAKKPLDKAVLQFYKGDQHG